MCVKCWPTSLRMRISVGTFCKKWLTERRRDGEMERQRDRETKRPPYLCLSIPPSLRLSVSISLFLSVFLAACGKIGPPEPPLPRAQLRVAVLGVEQRGAHLILSFPFKREPRTRLHRIDVYRLVEPLDAPMGLPIETFSERASVVYSILADDIPLDRSGVVYDDALNVKSELQNKRYRYAVRVFNTVGQAADFSHYATIEPLLNLALPPAKCAAKQFETQIEITWDPPAGNMNETSPANVAGYNIYRRQGGAFSMINAEPLREPRFADR